MNTHWTETIVEHFRYRITSDFLDQLIKKMKSEKISQAELAKKLRLSPGRVSQILNGEMNNFELESIISYARALGMKVSLVAYDDGDPDNERGPIDAEIFATCWERQGKPVDFFDLQERTNVPTDTVFWTNSTSATIREGILDNVEDIDQWRPKIGQTDAKELPEQRAA